MRVVFVFLDGVGIGPPDPDVNPFLRARLPVLDALLGGRRPTLADPAPAGPGGAVHPLDATLGVEGLPRSGTGQAALLTGHNAPRRYGRHFGPWTPVALRPLVCRESVLRAAQHAGRSAAFANAYPAGFLHSRRGRRPAAPPLAAHAAGLLTRGPDDLRAGRAVASEIVVDGWRRHLGYDGPDVSPAEAGAALARISAEHDLTFYAHYHTDTAGHRGGMSGAVEALERVDAFLGGLLDHLDPAAALVLASDHGNIEDVRAGHTTHPALLLVARGAVRATGRTTPGDLTDVKPLLLELLGSDDPPPH